MATSSLDSGFDLELVVGEGLLQHLAQLFMDVGSLRVEFDLGNDLNATLYARSDVRRTYTALPGADYAFSSDATFVLKARDFGSFDPEFVHFSVTVLVDVGGSRASVDMYFKLRRDIDVRAEVTAILAYVDKDVRPGAVLRPYDILNLFRLETILSSIATFDTGNPDNNAPGIWQPVVDAVNGGLIGFIVGLRDGSQPDALAFLRDELDPFKVGAVERLAFRSFPDGNNLGIHVNFRLLDHDSGWLGPRGSIALSRDFLPEGTDFAASTSQRFARRLVDDLLIKYVARFQVNAKILMEQQALELLDGDHFPLYVPRELVLGGEREEDDGEGALRFSVRDTSVDTRKYTFRDSAGNRTRAESLEVKLKTSASLTRAMGLADENVIAYLTPLDAEIEGVRSADLGLDTNVRADLLRTLVSLLNPLNWLKKLALPVIAVINLFVNASDLFAAVRVSDLGVDVLARLRVMARRWDPFYTTSHGLLLERRDFHFEDNRLFLSGLVHLSKTFEPFEDVWVREAETDLGNVTRLRYKVERASDTLRSDFFATDRENHSLEPDDAEPDIYSLEYADVAAPGGVHARMRTRKLADYLFYAPHCIARRRDEGHNHIAAIGMLNDLETLRLEGRLLSTWVDREVEKILAEFEDFGVIFTDEQRRQAAAELAGYVRDSRQYRKYMEDELATDVRLEIRDNGALRLALSPHQLKELRDSRVLDLPGYQSVIREGHLYFRDIADSSTEDNLLSLPDLPEFRAQR
jgi:hypothetical protein